MRASGIISCGDIMKAVMLWGVALLVNVAVVAAGPAQHENLDTEAIAAAAAAENELDFYISENLDLTAADTRSRCKDRISSCHYFLDDCDFFGRWCKKSCGLCGGGGSSSKPKCGYRRVTCYRAESTEDDSEDFKCCPHEFTWSDSECRCVRSRSCWHDHPCRHQGDGDDKSPTTTPATDCNFSRQCIGCNCLECPVCDEECRIVKIRKICPDPTLPGCGISKVCSNGTCMICDCGECRIEKQGSGCNYTRQCSGCNCLVCECDKCRIEKTCTVSPGCRNRVSKTCSNGTCIICDCGECRIEK